MLGGIIITDTKTEVDERLLYNLVVRSEKEISDRTNIIIAANSFLLLPLTNTLTSGMITGYLNVVPILICIIGVGLNPLLIYTNYFQQNKIKEFLNDPNRTSNFGTQFTKIGLEDAYKNFNRIAPPFLTIVWVGILIFVIFEKVLGIINIF